MTNGQLLVTELKSDMSFEVNGISGRKHYQYIVYVTPFFTFLENTARMF
jgi:hypothetical protein